MVLVKSGKAQILYKNCWFDHELQAAAVLSQRTCVLGPRKRWRCCLWPLGWSFRWCPKLFKIICLDRCLFIDLHNNHMQNFIPAPQSARMKEQICWLMLSTTITWSCSVSFPWIRRNYIHGGVTSTPPWCASISKFPYFCVSSRLCFETGLNTNFQMKMYGLYCVMMSLIPEIQMLQE